MARPGYFGITLADNQWSEEKNDSMLPNPPLGVGSKRGQKEVEPEHQVG